MTTRNVRIFLAASIAIAVFLGAAPAQGQGMPQDNFFPYTQWGSTGTGDGQFNSPKGVAVDSARNVYVADAGNSRIQVLTSEGVFIRKWGSNGTGDGQFNNPHGITLDSAGNVYVVDYGNNRVQVFNSAGVFIRKWGSGGGGDGQFSSPYGIALDTAGNIYVTDASNARIQKFTSTGVFVRKWGSSGSGDGQFLYPYGVAIDFSGNVYVTDNGSPYRIQVFTSEGVFSRKFTVGYTPTAIAVDSNGNSYVSYGYNPYYLNIYSPTGEKIGSTTLSSVGSSSYGIALNPTEDLLYISQSASNNIKAFKRIYRVYGEKPETVIPTPKVLSCAQRSASSVIDVSFKVIDSDSTTVAAYPLAFKDGANLLSKCVPMNSFVEGTASAIGASVPTDSPRTLSWDPAADMTDDYANLQVEILANDGRGLIDLHFAEIPSNGTIDTFRINSVPLKETDFLSAWLWLIASKDAGITFTNGEVCGVNAPYAGLLLTSTVTSGTSPNFIYTNTTTVLGRTFLYERLGVRAATAAEVTRAQQGNTPGVIKQWAPLYRDLLSKPGSTNGFNVDTSSTLFFVVKN